MKAQKKLYKFPCWCEKKMPLEKKMEVKALSNRKRDAEPIMIDVFCHWCGKDGKAPFTGDFKPDNPIRGDL